MNPIASMRIVSVETGDRKITVTTTGARFVIDASSQEGLIHCHQRINQDRLVATIGFWNTCSLFLLNQTGFTFTNVCVQHADEKRVVLHQGGIGCGYLRIEIGADSLLDISCTAEMILSVKNHFEHEYYAEKDGNLLLLDQTGGIGYYPLKGMRCRTIKHVRDESWTAEYTMNEEYQLLVSVFPPREFDLEAYFNDRIAHHGALGMWDPVPYPYPTDSEIEDLSAHANVLVLHDMAWQGKVTKTGVWPITRLADMSADFAWSSYDYVPVNEPELLRVIRKAHSRGMRVLPYMSPYYSMSRGRELLDRIVRAMDEYDLDGVYFDGYHHDILAAHEFMKDLRIRIGNKLVYLHCSFDPFMIRDVYCPFIETYADFILRSEGTTMSRDGSLQFNAKAIRYNVSGYNISNAIGHICHYDLPLDVMEDIMARSIEARIRFYFGSPETERERLLKSRYTPMLDRAAEARRQKDLP
jgi:hypothetical protein